MPETAPNTPSPEALAAARAAYDAAVETLRDECERYRAFLAAHRAAAGINDRAELTLANALLEGAFVDYDIGDIVAFRPESGDWRAAEGGVIGIALEFMPLFPDSRRRSTGREDLRVIWAHVGFRNNIMSAAPTLEESWRLGAVTPAVRDALVEAVARRASAEAADATRPSPIDTADILGAGPSA